MGKNNYWEEGYQKGLNDGKTIKNKKTIENIVKDICTRYSAENAQKYIDGWQAGFTKTLKDSINKHRKKKGLI